MNWITKYAPQSIDELILSSENRNILEKILEKPENALLHGSYGTGKSSFVRLLCEKYTCLHLNASMEGGIDTIRDKVKKFSGSMNVERIFDNDTPSRKIVVFEECDGLTKEAQAALKGVTDKFVKLTAYVFITNNIERIDTAIQSRCKVINFDSIPKDIIASHIKYILQQEEKENRYKDIELLVKECYPSVRTIIQNAEQYSISGDKLDIRSLGTGTQEGQGAQETQGTISRSLKTGEERRQVDRARSRRWHESQKRQGKKQISAMISQEAYERLQEMKGTKSYSQVIEDLILGDWTCPGICPGLSRVVQAYFQSLDTANIDEP